MFVTEDCIPTTDVLIKGRIIFEHRIQDLNGLGIPVAYVLVERRRSKKHGVHGSDIAYIPLADVLVEIIASSEGVAHIRDRRTSQSLM